MEQFKRTLKFRMAMLGVLLIACCGLFAFSMESGERLPDFLRGFQAGVASGMCAVAVIWLVKFGRVIQDETRLRIQYNKETDERMKAINAKAGMPLLWVTSVLMILVGMVGAYWEPMIFYTLVPAGVFQILASRIVALVYCRIM